MTVRKIKKGTTVQASPRKSYSMMEMERAFAQKAARKQIKKARKKTYKKSGESKTPKVDQKSYGMKGKKYKF